MRYSLFFLAIVFSSVSVRAAEPQVVATIKPLHSLVAAVMQDTGDQPLLLVDSKASPHTFSLKPSQVKALHNAKVIFYISDDFELFLSKTLSTLPKSVARVPMGTLAGITKYEVRTGAGFTPHDHDDHEEKDETTKHRASRDMHIWLLSKNVQPMVMEIARVLAMNFPEHKSAYFNNARRFNMRLPKMQDDIESRLMSVRNKPFIVFHDATQYFEKDYGLKAAGSIMLHADQPPGAKHISEIRERIKNENIQCVFREPSFDAKVVENLVEGTGAKVGVIDPEGALLDPGPELYFQMMENITKAFEDCLLAPPVQAPQP